MDPTENRLFSLAEQRLRWLNDRQVVLSRNIANLDTPGYAPQDTPDFATLVARSPSALARTNPLHLTAAPSPLLSSGAGPRSPDGNAVSLEEQLTKLADTESAHKLTSFVYRQYLNMFSLALGHTPA